MVHESRLVQTPDHIRTRETGGRAVCKCLDEPMTLPRFLYAPPSSAAWNLALQCHKSCQSMYKLFRLCSQVRAARLLNTLTCITLHSVCAAAMDTSSPLPTSC